jgi:hypothetical protein
MSKRVIFLFSFGSLHFFGYLKINIAACRHALCFYMTTVMLHRIIPPPFYSSLGKQQQQKKTLFCFALHLSFWRLWWFFWWRSIVFATVALDELPALNVQITTRLDRIFSCRYLVFFFLFGNNNRSAVGGGWRRSSDGPRTTPPPPINMLLRFSNKTLTKAKKQKKLTRSTMPVILPRAEKIWNRSIITQFLF